MSGPPLQPLDEVRVLELGRNLAVASAGLSLAALGADVVQVRRPDRNMRPADAAYYDRGRTVVEATDAAPDLAALARHADIVVTDWDDAELAAARVDPSTDRNGAYPQARVLIGSFGRWGPNADLATTDLIEWAAGGLAPVTRRPHPDDVERYVPVLPPGCQPQALAGIAAATAALVAHRATRRTGSTVTAEVSVQEVVASTLHGIHPHFLWLGITLGRRATPASALGMLLPALDGDVYIRTVDPRQWAALVEWVGDDTLDDLGATPNSRLANHDVITMLLSTWSATRSHEELVREGQRRRVPIALPRSLDEVMAWQHLRARGAWQEAELDGRATTVPRLPLLEPATWQPTRSQTDGQVAERWAAQA